MTRKKEASLTIERFYHGDDSEFRIPSRREMLSILQDMADKGTHAALYYDAAHNFIMTTVLAATEDGIWLDVGPFPPDNKRVLLSDKLTLVSLHQHVKIQFEVREIQSALYDEAEAFYIELPDYLIRIQRREYFRLSIPPDAPVKCIIPCMPPNPDKSAEPVDTREFPVFDISGGGIALLCEEDETSLQPGKQFQDCRISLPDFGMLKADLVVKNNVSFTAFNNTVKTRVGCELHQLSTRMQDQLHRYINQLQSELLAKQAREK